MRSLILMVKNLLLVPVTGCFGGGSPRVPDKAPPPAQEADSAVMASRDEERMRRRAAAGTTVFSGPQGATGTAAVQAKTLFGQ